MSRTSDNTMAFLLGALVGGAVAILLAPEKGEVTRQRLRRSATGAYVKGRGWVQETQEDVQDRIADIGDKAKEKAAGVADAARTQVDAVKGAIQEGREAYRRELGKHTEPQS